MNRNGQTLKTSFIAPFLTLFRANWQVAFSAFGVICALLASVAVLVNNLHYLGQHERTLTLILFALAFSSAFLPRPWGLMGVLLLIPLSAGLQRQLEEVFGLHFMALPNAGLDLVAGLFLGTLLLEILHPRKSKNSTTGLFKAMPWILGVALLFITASTWMAIARNLWMSASGTTLNGLLYNLIHFRPIDWRADYLPLTDWIAYSLAGALVLLVLLNLYDRDSKNKDQIIFRPLLAGLFAAAIIGLIQSVTGLGLPVEMLNFRKDAFGFAALGLQPDLHAFAAHMLLGVIGLWGYFLVCKTTLERRWVLAVTLISFVGLIASKSRASLVIALIALCIGGCVYLARIRHRYFGIIVLTVLVSIATVLLSLWIYLEKGYSIGGMQWINELFIQLKTRDLTSLSDLTGIFGSRIEIWSAANNMFSAYPFMGVGQGEFYRLSSNISFSRSYFLERNGGENAHNYFLQTLAENGLVGIGVFTAIFLMPWLLSRNRRLLYPAAIAILSLFLGNIFAHAFLVRENLLICASLLGLLYSQALVGANTQSFPLTSFSRYWKFGLIGIVISIFLASIYEFQSSFQQKPFLRGIDCYKVPLPITTDGWTSGAWEEHLPLDKRNLIANIKPGQPNLEKFPLLVDLTFYSWEPGKGKVPIATETKELRNNELVQIKLSLPVDFKRTSNIVTARLELINCFTPRNIGMSTDARRLGVQVRQIEWN